MFGANIYMCVATVYNSILLVKCINVLFVLEGNVITYNNSYVVMHFQYFLDLVFSTFVPQISNFW